MSAQLKIDDRTLITCKEAAKLYGCSMGYVRRLARDKRIFSTSIGRTYFVDRDQVLEIAQSAGRMAKGFSPN